MITRVCICVLHDVYDLTLMQNLGQRIPGNSADTLSLQESKWRDNYHYFLDHGFELCPRYRPGWIPSWIGTGRHELRCEDGFPAIFPLVMNAIQVDRARAVCIKMIRKKSNELEIGRYLVPNGPNSFRHPKNHCIPILDAFLDPVLSDVSYIVMPLLRPFNDPDFGAAGEVIDFVTQLLEGLDFMHERLVAHCDLTGPNIMMDAVPILPEGWHFNAIRITPHAKGFITPLPRIDHPVRYYIIDYDCAVRFRPGESPIIRGWGGRDTDVPELAPSEVEKPFDHFKLDVFTLGNVFLKDIRQKHAELEFLDGLIKFMMTKDFRERPTARDALAYWCRLMSKLGSDITRLQLRNLDPFVGDQFMKGIANLAWLFGEGT